MMESDGRIEIGKHFEAFVRQQVADGRYANASQVVCEGLRLLEAKEASLAKLRGMLAEGEESGVSHLTVEEIFEEERRRFDRG